MCNFAPELNKSRMLLNDSAPVMSDIISGAPMSATTHCGSDPLLWKPSKHLQEKMRQPLWYPMRVAYDKRDRVIQLQKLLDQQGIENFLPMTVVHERENFNVNSHLIPAIPGLIFIHDTRVVITNLKRQTAFNACATIPMPPPPQMPKTASSPFPTAKWRISSVPSPRTPTRSTTSNTTPPSSASPARPSASPMASSPVAPASSVASRSAAVSSSRSTASAPSPSPSFPPTGSN